MLEELSLLANEIRGSGDEIKFKDVSFTVEQVINNM